MSKVFFVVDVEATGPDFTQHNMYQFACVPLLSSGQILEGVAYDVELISDVHDPETLAFLKKELEITPDILKQRPNQIPAHEAMKQFHQFIRKSLQDTNTNIPVFVADNLAFDWGYIHTYFHRFLGFNPFGYAGRNIPCLSLGFYGTREAWEQHITRKHTHNALDDVIGNAGALSVMIKEGLQIT